MSIPRRAFAVTAPDDRAVLPAESGLEPEAIAAASRTSPAPERARTPVVDQAVLSVLDEGLIVLDRRGVPVRWNAAASRLLGVDLREASGDENWWEALGARDREGGASRAGYEAVRTGIEARGVEIEIARRGTRVWLSVNYLPLRDQTGSPDGVVVSIRDITGLRRERLDLVATQDRLREAHDVARLASWEWRPNTGEVVVFQALSDSGLTEDSVISFDDWLDMVPVDQRKTVFADCEDLVQGRRRETCRVFRYVLGEDDSWLEVRSRAVYDLAGKLLCVRGTAQDITERERSAQALAQTLDLFQATLDTLPFHVAVLGERGEIEMTNQAWREFAAANGADPRAVGVGANYLLVCDVAAGEPSAARTAAGIRAIAAGTSDAFSVEYECSVPGRRRWFEVHGRRYEGSGPVRVVITHEDITRRKAEEEVVAADLDKLARVARVEEALQHDGFVLHEQPIIDLESNRIVQRELLIRMLPEDGSVEPIPPGEFLPIAEEYGLITEIDRWVIDRAAELAAQGRAVELNISARSLGDLRLIDYIRSAIERTGVTASQLVFEVTETAIMEDESVAKLFLYGLHELGCKVALDDFGTGYGGFTYLKKLPVDFLKIDTEFVTDLASNPASGTVVRAIVRLARGFGLKTIAEGVEDERALSALRRYGVHYAQGFHIARPAPAKGR